MVDEARSSAVVDRTVLGAARMRAIHLLVDGQPKILRDIYAMPLTGWSEEEILARARDCAREGRQTSAWVARSRFAEDRLAAARARRVRQYVILGAGLDSFALRHAQTLGELAVYEVDNPPMQTWKRARIELLDLALPATLRFVPCDFETGTLPQALAQAGFDADAPAVVSWLGVTQYLTREAIAETLLWVSRLAAGSEMIFTFIVPGPEAVAERERIAAIGGRFETFFTPEHSGPHRGTPQRRSFHA
jgi:methyltransferase (TIGR00027 family)